MAVRAANSPFNICYVHTASSLISPEGVVTAGPLVNLFFQSARLYSNTDVAARTGITYVDGNHWEGEEPLIKIEQLILSRKLVRLIGEIDLGTAGIKNVALLCAREKAGGLLSDDPTLNLDAKPYINNNGIQRGTFFNVRTATRNRYA